MPLFRTGTELLAGHLVSIAYMVIFPRRILWAERVLACLAPARKIGWILHEAMRLPWLYPLLQEM
jgi:hypothetical protein